MTSDYVFLMSVLHLSGGSIEGRKRFQKKVCVLKYRDKIPFTFEYTPYYYGPFSEGLASALDNLVGLGYIKEDRQEFSGLLRYTYLLTDSGMEFAKKQIQVLKKNAPKLFKTLSLGVAELKDKETYELVKLSKEVTKNLYV